jgi:ATP-binding cassette, subfamily C, bacterial
MLQVLKIFFYAEKTKPWLVLTCLLLGGLAEAAGIGSLLPVANSMLGNNAGPPSPLETYLRGALDVVGLSPSLEVLLLMLTLLLLLRSALLFTAATYSGMAGARVTVNLRQRLIKAIFEARWSFYNEQSGGKIANALANNAGRAGEAYSFAAMVASILVQISAYLFAAFLINWRVALAGLTAGLLVAAVSGRLVKISRKSGRKITDRVASFTADMIDVMHNIKALKSMHRYEPLVDRLGVKLRQIKRNLLRANVARAGLTHGNDAMIAIVVAVSAYLAHTYANATLPELTVFGVLFYQVIYCISRLQKNYQSSIEIESAYTSVIALIDSAEAAQEPHLGKKTPDIGKGCQFENVSFAHGEQPTVKSLNFLIPVNKITVLQGPSGAGKTTIIDLLIGFHRPQKGAIKIGADELNDIDIVKWRKNIGYVPQELVLFHDSVRANITLSDESITDLEVINALDRAGASEFAHNLSADVGEMGGKLSGGQKQRISLARALVKNPKIIILDEVTSALDPETEAEIVRNIRDLRGAYTIIAITHRPAWTAIADKLYKVQSGHISELKRASIK